MPSRRNTMSATCAAAALMLAVALAGPAQADRDTDFTEDEYRMFGSFYRDSHLAISDMLAGAGMPESLEAFKRAPESLQRELCPAVRDLALSRSIVIRALFHPDFNEDWANLWILRIVFDQAGVEWMPLSDVAPEEKPALFREKDELKEFLKQRWAWLSERYRYCLVSQEAALELVSSYELVSARAPAPLESRLRDYYESQMPFLAWAVAYLRENESRLDAENLVMLEELEALIPSIERKYGLSALGRNTLPAPAGAMSPEGLTALDRWPAAWDADPAWDWPRTLIFLLQAALVVQGHDPGPPDGVMRPETILAMIEWSATKGPFANDEHGLFMFSLSFAAVSLLHGTLEALGLSPGAQKGVMEWEARVSLVRWESAFRGTAFELHHRGDEDEALRVLMEEFDEAGPAEAGAATDRPAAQDSTDGSGGGGKPRYECLKVFWSEDSPNCHPDFLDSLGNRKCLWGLHYNNTCSHGVHIELLIDQKDGNGPLWHQSAISHRYWAGTTSTAGSPIWSTLLPPGVTPEGRFCTHKWDPHGLHIESRFDDPNEDGVLPWYRIERRDQPGDPRRPDGTYFYFAPNTDCLDTY